MKSCRSKGAVFAHTIFISATVDFFCRFLSGRLFFTSILSVIISGISLLSGKGFHGIIGSNLNNDIKLMAEFKTKTL